MTTSELDGVRRTDDLSHEELHMIQAELARQIVARADALADMVFDSPIPILSVTVEAGLLREQCRQYRAVTLQLTRGDGC